MIPQRSDDAPAILRFPSQTNSEITAAEVVAAYLDFKRAEVRAGRYEQDSLDRKAPYLNSFLIHVGGPSRVASLANADMKRWILSHPEWQSSNTILDAMGAVCSCFAWAAYEAEIIDRCPFKRSASLCPPPEPMPPLEPEEYHAVMNASRGVNHRRKQPSASAFRCGLFFLWETGSRTKEMRTVRIEWIDWRESVIRVPRESHKTGRKTGKPRLIAFGAKLGRVLRWLCRRRTSGLIFRNGRNRAWRCQAFADQFRKYADAAGVRKDATPYTARHGFTVRCLESGLTSKEVADLNGHATSSQVERVYGASTRFKAKRLTDSLAKVRPDNAPPKNTPT